jgi:hypothetical protein
MRRMFRRHIRKMIAQEVPPILQEANFAVDKGEFGRAGELFKRLAETTSARGGPRSPLFHLKAGGTRIRAMRSNGWTRSPWNVPMVEARSDHNKASPRFS